MRVWMQGSRVAATFPPCAVTGPVLTIRKFTRRYSLDDLTTVGTLSSGVAAQLAEAVKTHQNVLRRLHVSLTDQAPRTNRSTQHPAITTSILRLASTLSRFSASLRPPFGAHDLDRLSVEPMEGTCVMAGRQERPSRKERTMRAIAPAPNITVMIGG
jgi:hypothetical protein